MLVLVITWRKPGIKETDKARWKEFPESKSVPGQNILIFIIKSINK